VAAGMEIGLFKTENKIVEKAAWNAGAHGVPRASVRLLSTFGQAP
jgi:hypothetical protein